MFEAPQFVQPLQKSTKQFGLSFTCDAQQIWNDLPDDVHFVTSLFVL